MARLTPDQQLKIAEYHAANPDIKPKKLAGIFTCTVDQARYALKKAANGELGKYKTKRKTKVQTAINADTDKRDSAEIFDKQIKFAALQLEKNEELSASSRIDIIDKASRAQQRVEGMILNKAIHGMDFAILTEIVRKYEPDASRTDIVRIFREAEQTCKINSQN